MLLTYCICNEKKQRSPFQTNRFPSRADTEAGVARTSVLYLLFTQQTLSKYTVKMLPSTSNTTYGLAQWRRHWLHQQTTLLYIKLG